MKKNLAFTIVEFLIYMGILAVLLLFFADLFNSLTNVRSESESTSTVQQDGNYLINKFFYDIHQATSISLPLHPGDQSNTLKMVINGTNYTYATQSGNLILSDGTNNYQMNGYDTTVPGLLFTRLGQGDSHDTIKINFTVTSLVTSHSSQLSKTYETVVGLR